jgi:hypothetical protein
VVGAMLSHHVHVFAAGFVRATYAGIPRAFAGAAVLSYMPIDTFAAVARAQKYISVELT